MIDQGAESHTAAIVDQLHVALGKDVGEVRKSASEAGFTHSPEGISVSAEARLGGQLIAVSFEFGEEVVPIGLGQVGDKAIGEGPHRCTREVGHRPDQERIIRIAFDHAYRDSKTEFEVGQAPKRLPCVAPFIDDVFVVVGPELV